MARCVDNRHPPTYTEPKANAFYNGVETVSIIVPLLLNRTSITLHYRRGGAFGSNMFLIDVALLN